MLDKNGREIRVGDTLFNPWDDKKYHQVIEGTDGRLYLGDLGSPLECYAPDKYWEITNYIFRKDNWPHDHLLPHDHPLSWDAAAAGMPVEDDDTDLPSQEAYDAPAILRQAAQTIEDRAAQRDLPAERSMARAVGAFNTLTGQDLTETQGWLFVAVLKLARATAGKHNPDDLLDAAAYVALALENEIGEQK